MFYIVIKNISNHTERLYSSTGYSSVASAITRILELGYVNSEPKENSIEFAFVVDDRINDLKYGTSYYSCIVSIGQYYN